MKIYYQTKPENYVIDVTERFSSYDELKEAFEYAYPNIAEKTEAEYDKYILETQTLPGLAQDSRYTSVHKNAESVIQNSVLTQILELSNNVDTIALAGGNANVSPHLTINGVQVDSAQIVTLPEKDKITKLLAYKREMLIDEVAKQRIMYNDVVAGDDISKAIAHASRLKLKTQDAIDGKALHITWLKAVLTEDAYNTYLKNTASVEYSTHLSEDEPQ